MELLGNSQTFLGVLATIVILFIIFNSRSNPILHILEHEYDRKSKHTDKQIESDLKKLKISGFAKNAITEKLESSRHYKQILEQYIPCLNQNNADNNLNKLRNEATSLITEITTSQTQLHPVYSEALSRTTQQEFTLSKTYDTTNLGELQKTIQKKLKNFFPSIITPSLASLYTFIFCIIIFISDEILRLDILRPDILISTLSIFIVISYLYWVVLWSKLCSKEEEKESSQSKLSNWSKKHLPLIQNLYLAFVVRLIVFAALLIVPLIANAYWFPINNYIIIIILFLIILSKGILRIIPSKKEDYSYLFPCAHCFAFVAMAFLFTGVIFYVTRITQTSDSFLIPYDNYNAIKIAAFLFILLNGLILPFIIPYYVGKQIISPCIEYAKFVNNTVNNCKKEEQKIINRYEKRLKRLCRRIKKERIQRHLKKLPFLKTLFMK